MKDPPFVRDLVQFRLPFSHDNILSPDSLMSIGPMLSKLLINNLVKVKVKVKDK